MQEILQMQDELGRLKALEAALGWEEEKLARRIQDIISNGAIIRMQIAELERCIRNAKPRSFFTRMLGR